MTARSRHDGLESVRRKLAFAGLVGVALVVGLQERTMSDEGSAEGLPAASLSSPGVVTTHETKPFEELDIYSVYISVGRRLHTVAAFKGRNSEDPAIQAFEPVDWETAVVPQGAQLFSVTAGVSAETVTQFWVGWFKDRTVFLEALTEQHPIKAELASGEVVVFPAVMDGSGAASLFSWSLGDGRASLWQRTFKGKSASAHAVVEVPGHPLISRVAAVPGHAERAVVGWVERAPGASLLGMALVERGTATIWRSEPIAATAPVSEQRIGVWASTDGRLEVCAILAERDGATYRLAHLGARRGESKVALRSEGMPMKEGQLSRAAIEYSSSLKQAVPAAYLLTKDGHLLEGRGLRVLRRSVPLDSPLPIVEGFWVSTKTHGKPQFEKLRP